MLFRSLVHLSPEIQLNQPIILNHLPIGNKTEIHR